VIINNQWSDRYNRESKFPASDRPRPPCISSPPRVFESSNLNIASAPCSGEPFGTEGAGPRRVFNVTEPARARQINAPNPAGGNQGAR